MKKDKPKVDPKTAAGRILSGMGRKLWDEAPPLGTPHGSFKRARLSDYLPYRYWDAVHDLYEQDHTLGFILELVPLIGGDDTTSRILSELFTEALPSGAHCQVISWASPKIGDVVDGWARERCRGGEVYAELGRHRREHFRKAAFASACRSAPFYFRDFRVFVAVELPGGSDGVAAQELVEVREKFVSALRTIHVPSEAVTPARLIAVMEDLLNPTRTIRASTPTYDPDRYICEQMIRPDTTWTRYRDKILIQSRGLGDQFDAEDYERELDAGDDVFEMRGFSAQQFPENWSQAMMSRTLGDMFNDQLRLVGSTLVSLCFTPWTAAKTKSTTEFKRMRTEQAANNPLTKAFPAVRKKAEDWAAVAEDVADGALLSQMALFVVSVSPVDDAERAERSLRSVFRAARFGLQRDDDIHIQTLLACLPLSMGGGLHEDLRAFGRLRQMPTTVASRLAPMQGEYVGSTVPHLMLVGRRGQPFYWSNFGNAEGNHNTAVVGSSGSGKSVFMQETATALRGAGCEVFVIDDGFSFMSSCQLQGGAFLRFSLDLQVCVNPFSMADHELAAREPEYEAETKRNIAVQIETMCRGEARASPEERGVIDQCVNLVWDRKGADGCIDDVRDVMLGRWSEHAADDACEDEEEDREGAAEDECHAAAQAAKLGAGGKVVPPAAAAAAASGEGAERLDFGRRGRDLALSLTAFTSEGTYGRFFNGAATLEITNPYTVFEMSDLETKKDLRAVIVLAVMFLVRQRMKKGGRELRKALIIDEAWALLGDGSTGEFIEGFARRCRKEGGSIITGTQSINDYYKTSGARACLENSDWQVILRLKPEALEQLRKETRLSIDEAGMQLLKSLKTSEGEFSELMIQGPSGRFVGRLVLDRYSVTLYSTKPQVYAAVQNLRSRGVPLHEAVRAVAFNEAPVLASAPPALAEEDLAPADRLTEAA